MKNILPPSCSYKAIGDYPYTQTALSIIFLILITFIVILIIKKIFINNHNSAKNDKENITHYQLDENHAKIKNLSSLISIIFTSAGFILLLISGFLAFLLLYKVPVSTISSVLAIISLTFLFVGFCINMYNLIIYKKRKHKNLPTIIKVSIFLNIGIIVYLLLCSIYFIYIKI